MLHAVAASTSFAALTAGIGADYYSGAQKQSSRDAVAYAATSWKGRDLTVAAARYEHSVLGSGTTATAALGVPVTSRFALQLLGARTIGAESYRASFLQSGPVFAVGQGRTLGILYTRSENNIGTSSSGLTSELGWPISASLNAYARGSVASVDGGGTSLQGSAGATWGLASRVLLVAEFGVGRDAVTLAQGGATGGLPGVLGRSSPAADEATRGGYVSGAAVLIGMRYAIR